MRRTAILVSLVGLVLASCSAQERVEWRNGPPPLCDTTSRGRLLLMAQSVPEASLIPCIGPLPPGWEFLRASSRSSQSTLTFSNTTFDLDVVVVLAPACDDTRSREVESWRPGTRLFVGGDGEHYAFAFDGGCITFDFGARPLAESPQGRALIDAVPFMTRARLRQLSGWRL